MSRPVKSLEERFWPKVNKDGANGCWLWTGALFTTGYGMFWMGGNRCAAPAPAHRTSLILNGTAIPPGMFVDHICRVRPCVNPAHLRVVTPRQNAVENNDSPLAKNAQKTHCKYGHPLSGDNITMATTKGPKGSPCKTRICLTCRRNRFAPSSFKNAGDKQ